MSPSKRAPDFLRLKPGLDQQNLESLNKFIQQTVDFCRSIQPVYREIRVSLDPDDWHRTFPILVPNPLDRDPVSVTIAQITTVDNNYTPGDANGTPSWTRSGASISIDYIPGLARGILYSIVLGIV